MRLVGSIAMVHETLSRVPDEIVDFDDIAGRVAMMAGELSAPESRVSPRLTGSFGQLSALIATPLALVLTELMQNALQHGLIGGPAPAGSVLVRAERGPGQLSVSVEDNGTGLPEGFSLDAHASLGLQIVRTLVESELGGELVIAPRPGGGTSVRVALPVKAVAVPSSRPEPGGTDSMAADSGARENGVTVGHARKG